jgi:transcriptional regulator with XRE-family HTH domain
MNPILAAIEQRRRMAGYSSDALGDVAGVAGAAIRRWYHGDRGRRPQSPTLATLEPVAEVLGLRLALEPIAPEPLAFVRWRGRR